MKTLELFKITDTSGKTTGEVGKVTYQALTDDEGNHLIQLEGDYSYIGRDFKVEMLGKVQIPSWENDKEKEKENDIRHVCGLSGFDPMKGDHCEACECIIQKI